MTDDLDTATAEPNEPTTRPRPAAGRTPRRRSGSVRTRVVTFAICTVLALGAGELIAGVLGPRLHDAPLFHSTEADLKVEQMQSRSDVDVVFVGSSVVGVAAEPSVVEAATGATVYNASLAAASPPLLSVWLDDVILPELEPSVVVIGLTSYDFYADQGDTFRDAFLESRGHRMLTGDESLMDRADRFMYQRSNLWRYRSDLRDPYTILEALAGGVVSDDWAEITDDDGHLMPAEVPGGFDKGGPDLSAWTIDADATDDLRQMIESATAAGSRVVLVGMPAIDPYIALHPGGEADFAEYETAIRSVAADADVPLLFYDDRDLSMFNDRVHMNAAGATAFSERVAEDLRRLGVLDGTWAPEPDGFGSATAPSLSFSRG